MKKDFLKMLTDFVGVQSVSTDPAYINSVLQAVGFVQKYLTEGGLAVQIIKGFENPVIVAKTKEDKSKKTVLVYGHYDVQPATKEDGWKSDPFVLTKKNGKLFARGVADNKAQIFSHMYAVVELLKKGELAYNVIFLIEGNEETGSAQLGSLVKKYKKILKSDCIVVSDGELAKGNAPALEVSFRGSANFEITFETGKQDVHSGLFGGAVPNALEELGKILGKITDFTGAKHGFVAGTKKYEQRRSLEPTVEVTGFSGGYTGTGFRNSIACKAVAKINVRSAPTQDIKRLVGDIQAFLKKQVPRYAQVSFSNSRSCNGAEFDVKNVYAQRAVNALKDVYKKKVEYINSGGTLPIASTFEKVLGVPQIMLPLADHNCGAHSASEFTSVDVLEKGIEVSLKFFGKDR